MKNAFRSGGEERNVTGFIDPSCDTEMELFISGTAGGGGGMKLSSGFAELLGHGVCSIGQGSPRL